MKKQNMNPPPLPLRFQTPPKLEPILDPDFKKLHDALHRICPSLHKGPIRLNLTVFEDALEFFCRAENDTYTPAVPVPTPGDMCIALTRAIRAGIPMTDRIFVDVVYCEENGAIIQQFKLRLLGDISLPCGNGQARKRPKSESNTEPENE